MKVFLNGRILPAARASVSVFDHGFLYGDGIYETVHADNGRIFRWPDHFRRLKRSARKIALACPWSSVDLEKALVRLLRANGNLSASVRITLSRGPGDLGLDPALSPRPTLAMMLHPVRDVERYQREGVSIGIPRIRRNHPACLDPRIKSNNSLNTLLAKMEAKRMGVFEAVLLNLDGHLTEGTTTNLFFVKKGRLFTPALSCGLLEGVTRGTVIQLARRAGRRVREGRYTPDDLKKADEVFLTSTTLEVAPVVRVMGTGGFCGAAPPALWRRHCSGTTRAWYNSSHLN